MNQILLLSMQYLLQLLVLWICRYSVANESDVFLLCQVGP